MKFAKECTTSALHKSKKRKKLNNEKIVIKDDHHNTMINIFSSSRYKINKQNLQTFAQTQLDKHHVAQTSALNIAFVGKRKMKEVAAQYKNENVALPVLSFSYLRDPISSTDNVIGEVVICYPQAVLLAAERDKRVEPMMQHLIEHGIQNIFMK